MTHEEILSMLGDYVDYLIANSSAEAPMWNIEKVQKFAVHRDRTGIGNTAAGSAGQTGGTTT